MFASHKNVYGVTGSARVVVRFTPQAEDITNGIPTGQNRVELLLAMPCRQAPFQFSGAGAHIRPGGTGYLHAQAHGQQQIRVFIGGRAQRCRINAGFQFGWSSGAPDA